MSNMEERGKGFESKFAHDEELRFKAISRRNKLLGQWAAEKLGKSGDDVQAYVSAVVKADLAEAGDEDVIRKVMSDFEGAAVNVSDAELRLKIHELLQEAVDQLT